MYRKIIYKKYLSSVNISKEELENGFNKDLYMQKEIIDNLPDNKSAYILDLGCGYGTFLNMLRKKGYKNLFGVEVGEEQNNFLNNKGLNIYENDILKFFKQNKKKYDLITIFDVLEHFNKNEIIELLPYIRDSLTTEGTLIIRVPNGEAMFGGNIMYGDFTHETYFTQRSMKQLFKIFEFKKINIYPTYTRTTTWKSKLVRLLYMILAKIYKILLIVDNGVDINHLIATQNILGIIKK